MTALANLSAAAGAVLLLMLVGVAAAWVPGGIVFLTLVLPYLAFSILLIGVCYRVWRWAQSPVPFRIPTTCGQQRSLPWIRTAPVDNPSNGLGVVARMAFEVLAFRSLLRNVRPHIRDGRLSFSATKALWFFALVFHWSLLVVVLRHLRFAVEPAPAFVLALNSFDRVLQIGAPALFLTDVALVAALCWLLVRRYWNPATRYLSVFSDYFALLLLLAIAGSGVLMRYGARVDVVAIKEFTLGLAAFRPRPTNETSPLFHVHLLLVCALAIYIPFSKLMHFGGIWLSPTRNLANNSRSRRHINPWNQPVLTHPYAEWEGEFADKLELAGLALDKVDHAGPDTQN